MRLTTNDRHIQLAVSVGAGVAGQFISLIAPLILMPAMLDSLGEVPFGIWAASVAVTGVTAFLDLGIGSGLLSRLARAYGLHDYDAGRRYVASAYAVLGAIGLAGISVLVFATAVGIGSHFLPETWSIVIAVLASFFVGMPASIIYRILQARLQMPLQSAFQILGAVLSIVACLTAIELEAAASIVVAAYSCTPVIVMIGATVWYFFRFPLIKPRFKDFSFEESRRLVSFGSCFFLLSILTAIGSNADILIISYVAGPESVANFVPPMRLGTLMALLVGQLFMPLWSFHGEALARGDLAWVRRTTFLMSVGGAMLVLILGLALVILSDFIMEFWMRRTFENQALVLLAMTASSTVIAFTAPYNMVLNAKGLAREQIGPWLAFVLISVFLKFWLVTEGTAWMAPAITFFCYFMIVTPAMIYQGRRTLAHS